jgi:hypothetical protein
MLSATNSIFFAFIILLNIIKFRIISFYFKSNGALGPGDVITVNMTIFNGGVAYNVVPAVVTACELLILR